MAKKEKKAGTGFDVLAVTDVQVYPFRDGAICGKILALATVVLNDQLTIRGLRVMDGEYGMFVGYPNDPFYKGEALRSIVFPISRALREHIGSIVFPITRALREHIENCVLEKYQYEIENASVKFEVELTHRDLSGAALQMEIIAASEKEAETKAKARAVEIIPSTKDSKDEWTILKVEKHE